MVRVAGPGSAVPAPGRPRDPGFFCFEAEARTRGRNKKKQTPKKRERPGCSAFLVTIIIIDRRYCLIIIIFKLFFIIIDFFSRVSDPGPPRPRPRRCPRRRGIRSGAPDHVTPPPGFLFFIKKFFSFNFRLRRRYCFY